MRLRCTHLLPLLLVSCQTWGWTDTADALMPDSFELGRGSSTSSLGGGVTDGWHDFDFSSDGESESTYAALTWDIPSVGRDESGMDRTTQRNLSLLIDQMVEDEIGESPHDRGSSSPLGLNVREGASLPPVWVICLFGLTLASLVVAAVRRSRRKMSWR